MGHEIAPGLAFFGRHAGPFFGALEKFRALHGGHAGELGIIFHALFALLRRQLFEGLQSFLHLVPLGFGKRVERLRFFLGGEFKELVELFGNLLLFLGGHDGVGRFHAREVMQRFVVGEQFRLQGRRQQIPLGQTRFYQFLQVGGDFSQLRVAFGAARAEQGREPPAQFRGAQAQLAFVRAEDLIFVNFGKNAGAGFRCAIGQRLIAFRHGHREQLPKKSDGRLARRERGRRQIGIVAGDFRRHRRGRLGIRRDHRQRGGEGEDRLAHLSHCKAASNSPSAWPDWLMRSMVSKFSKASTLGNVLALATMTRLLAIS